MKKNSTLIELLIGILVVGVLGQLVLLLFFESYIYNAIGLWVGVGIAAGMAIHMQRSIEDGLDLMGETGIKYMQKASALRTVIACVVIAAVLYFGWGSPLTLLLGVMALKLAAYMQPLMHRVLEKIKKGG